MPWLHVIILELFVPVIRTGVEGNVTISDHIKSSENVRVIL